MRNGGQQYISVAGKVEFRERAISAMIHVFGIKDSISQAKISSKNAIAKTQSLLAKY
jgi:hypothetical protein